MKRNRIKIVSNSGDKKLSFFFQNERDEWNLVSNASELSRSKFTTISIKDNIDSILQVINEDYNIGNRGIDILFEGSSKDYDIICQAIKKDFSNDDIKCILKKTAVAVAGKIGVGKSTLINEIVVRHGKGYKYFQNGNITGFIDDSAAITWYEIPGIDLGKEKVIEAMDSFDQLAKNGVTNFIYCLDTNKIEELEEQFIIHVQEKYPGVKILVALTMCKDDNDAEILSTHIQQFVGDVKIIPTLSKDLKTRAGVIPAYGVDEVIQYLFEGK